MRTIVWLFAPVVALVCGGVAGLVADLYLFGLWLHLGFLYDSIHEVEARQGFYVVSAYAPIWLTGVVLGLVTGALVRSRWRRLSPWVGVGYVLVPHARLLVLDAPGTSVDTVLWGAVAVPLLVLSAFAGARLVGGERR